jgi:hypothetical protein
VATAVDSRSLRRHPVPAIDHFPVARRNQARGLPAPGPVHSNRRDYWCGVPLFFEFSTWLLQCFFTSLFDMLGLLASSEAMQSVICCLCDLLVVLVVDDCVVVVVLLLLGYVEC